MISLDSYRRTAIALGRRALLIVLVGGLAAKAQSLSVLPVNVGLSPGQNATTLTVTNHGTSETAVQIRVYGWNQRDGEDQLTPSDMVVVSPPIASIAAGSSQVVRLILRQPPHGREATYRILVDQIPPPAEPGIVHVVLRMSIPVFALPDTRAVPHLQFHIERDADSAYLVARNDGGRHEVIRNAVLSTNDGRTLGTQSNASPYILAGATRRWPIAVQGALPQASETLRLKAHADAGAVEQQVRCVAGP
jgi:fimbrial chaperone protein